MTKQNLNLTMKQYRLLSVIYQLGLAGIFAICLYSTANAASRGISMESKSPAQNLSSMSKGTFRALIIGNDNYNDTKGKWPSLSTAVTDAKSVAKTLKEHYGFTDIELAINATRKQMLSSLNNIAKRVNPDDSVLLYYAGHGFLDSETNKGYWIPTDAQGTDNSTFLRNSTIRDEMEIIASRVKHTLLISDSCFSGSLLRTASRGILPETGIERYYNKVAKKKSVQIMSAGGLEYVDDDYRDSGHSPFTYFLLNELKSNNKPIITLSELSTNVEKAVANNVDQTPETGVLQGAGDELGEFIFLKIEVKIDAKGISKENIKVDVKVTPEPDNIEVTNESARKKSTKKKKPRTKKSIDTFIPLPTL